MRSIFRAGAAAALLSLGASGCTETYRNHGYVPPADQLALVEVGDSREEVGATIGRPTATGLLSDAGWFYVKSRYRDYGWRPPEEIDRQVVAVSFSEAGRVRNVERFGRAAFAGFFIGSTNVLQSGANHFPFK